MASSQDVFDLQDKAQAEKESGTLTLMRLNEFYIPEATRLIEAAGLPLGDWLEAWRLLLPEHSSGVE